MVMGRPNKGVDHLDNCDCSELARQRGKLILQTITGELSVQDACDEMGIQRPRFQELRARALQCYSEGVEAGHPGRPRTRDVERDEREAELLSRIASLERQLEVAEAKALVAQLQRGKKGGKASPPRPEKRR
jgi:hypothetical protein